ncbi:hypothetical protein NADFUDRAFT_81450 [Nadsonia fulvescens var. elongata DSM 6958]|uniref:Uncharacterized protein n=1 Tax=Nadsonia fulvescens var. elongata DSM 6958 TaxID=857566 RepID=A0A1E3PSV4_9ASCO|nr:hypothetical protein NADFUDRAFT_81450 [Nadsonia fulvescens var. elongata DSM 6958]
MVLNQPSPPTSPGQTYTSLHLPAAISNPRGEPPALGSKPSGEQDDRQTLWHSIHATPARESRYSGHLYHPGPPTPPPLHARPGTLRNHNLWRLQTRSPTEFGSETDSEYEASDDEDDDDKTDNDMGTGVHNYNNNDNSDIDNSSNSINSDNNDDNDDSWHLQYAAQHRRTMSAFESVPFRNPFDQDSKPLRCLTPTTATRVPKSLSRRHSTADCYAGRHHHRSPCVAIKFSLPSISSYLQVKADANTVCDYIGDLNLAATERRSPKPYFRRSRRGEVDKENGSHGRKGQDNYNNETNMLSEPEIVIVPREYERYGQELVGSRVSLPVNLSFSGNNTEAE